MQTYPYKKIDLGSDYPCPCCRRGRLSSITLTEALGCERCQEIFVLNDQGYVIEGLKTAYPYPKKWYWTGHQWNLESQSHKWFYVLPPLIRFAAIAMVVSAAVVMLSILLPVFANVLAQGQLAGVAIALLVVLGLWVAYVVYRR